MNEKVINQQIKTMEKITSFIDHFRSLHIHNKYLVLKDNWSMFEYWKNELEKFPNTPPPFLQSQYQSWLKWGKTNFECMKELREKMITTKTFIDFLKACKENRKLSKLKELINQK